MSKHISNFASSNFSTLGAIHMIRDTLGVVTVSPNDTRGKGCFQKCHTTSSRRKNDIFHSFCTNFWPNIGLQDVINNLSRHTGIEVGGSAPVSPNDT
jgi:hypothetical protein